MALVTPTRTFTAGAPIAYFRNGFNIFDFLVVILTGIQVPDSVILIQCYLFTQDTCSSANAGVSVLRMFRLARLVRLIRSFPQVGRGALLQALLSVDLVVDRLNVGTWQVHLPGGE